MTQTTNLTLTPGQTYDLNTLVFAGWTTGDGSTTDGYNVADYFPGSKYLGPDEHGIEPIFAGLAR